MVLLVCKKCGWKWDYNGKKDYYCTCPNCLSKVKIEEYKKEVGG